MEACSRKSDREANASLGIAVDMGTTLVCVGVVDLNTGKEIARSSQPNAQISFGDNLISRINFALHNREGLKRLNRALIDTINIAVKEALESAGREEKEVLKLVAVGNTLMHHLLLSIMPTALITPPYGPAATDITETKAKDLGISLDHDLPIRILPNLGGFVGSDCLGMILAAGIPRADKIKLAIDLGTNGNIVLGSREKILVTSTAAGGAFEGRHISSGMRGKEGAIEGVEIKDGKVSLEIIGYPKENKKGKAQGICGSGLIDAVAQMLEAGIVDKRGGMKEKEFLLYQDDLCSVKITPGDVREMQLAKGSIHAGVKILEKELGIESADISEVFLSGAFGNKIRKESVLKIGLIPEVSEDKITFIGNGALKGAEMALSSEEEYSRALAVREKIEHIPLEKRGDFEKEFVQAMGF